VNAVCLYRQRNINAVIYQKEGFTAYLSEPGGFFVHHPGFGIFIAVLNNFDSTGYST
jgi:hypothetical protein